MSNIFGGSQGGGAGAANIFSQPQPAATGVQLGGAPAAAAAARPPSQNDDMTLRETLREWRTAIHTQAQDFLKQAEQVASYDEQVRAARLLLFDLGEETDDLVKETKLLDEAIEKINARHSQMEGQLADIERAMDTNFPTDDQMESAQSAHYTRVHALDGYSSGMHSSRAAAYSAARQLNTIIGSLETQLQELEGKIQEDQAQGKDKKEDVRERGGGAAGCDAAHTPRH
jgi:chromosome segregation ATPase